MVELEGEHRFTHASTLNKMAFWLVVGILVLSALLLLTIILLVFSSGVFHPIEVKAGRPPVGNICVAYKFRKGPYSECGELFTEAVKLAPDNRSIGVYYDDPSEVASSDLRYIVGCILAEGDETPDKDLVEKLKDKGFGTAKFPKIDHCVHTTFPHTSFLSIYIAVYRVYPMLGDYVKKQKLCAHPFIEIYDKETIYYVGPLAKQNEFYVPEVTDTPSEESSEKSGSSKQKLSLDTAGVQGPSRDEDQHLEREAEQTPSAEEGDSESGSSDSASGSESPFEELNIADSSGDDKE